MLLLLLIQVIGSPSEADIAFVGSDKARRYLRSIPHCPRADFRKLYPDADEQVSTKLPLAATAAGEPHDFNRAAGVVKSDVLVYHR